jgi:hypothetical protein
MGGATLPFICEGCDLSIATWAFSPGNAGDATPDASRGSVHLEEDFHESHIHSRLGQLKLVEQPHPSGEEKAPNAEMVQAESGVVDLGEGAKGARLHYYRSSPQRVCCSLQAESDVSCLSRGLQGGGTKVQTAPGAQLEGPQKQREPGPAAMRGQRAWNPGGRKLQESGDTSEVPLGTFSISRFMDANVDGVPPIAGHDVATVLMHHHLKLPAVHNNRHLSSIHAFSVSWLAFWGFCFVTGPILLFVTPILSSRRRSDWYEGKSSDGTSRR